MTDGLRRRPRFETAIAAHIGFVDGFGFVFLGGFFVSSIEATTTQAGVALGDAAFGAIGLPATILAGFVAGVVAAALAGNRWPRERVTGALLIAVGALVAAGIVGQITEVKTAIGLTMAIAIGAENTLVQSGGVLVDMARTLSEPLNPKGPDPWMRYLRLWAAVVVGALAGAAVFKVFGLNTVWVAAGSALLAALPSGRSAPNQAD